MLLSNQILRKLARLAFSFIENLVLYFSILHCPHCIFQGGHRLGNMREKNIPVGQGKSGNFEQCCLWKSYPLNPLKVPFTS